ncbi:MAG: 2-amino-4-hydroxy-6-hydroxymethyldihydropteridine diphosphokinase [Planctomycetaceae bacterium]
MARCLVGCGSNLGDRREQLDRAVELLGFMPGVSLEAVSRFRETRPVGGPAGQSAYLNAACLIETDLGPAELLGALAAVEQTLLRQRSDRWGPRTIDLDLLLYDDLVLDGDELTVPHPRMVTRRFVLEPCVEIAAGFAHPACGCTLGDLLDNISVPHPLVAVVGAPGSGAAAIAEAVADATLSRHLPAPAPVPADGDPAAWRETAEAWARPLAARGWDDAGHGTVADFWLDGLLVAAATHLDPATVAALEGDVRRLAGGTVVPNVAILLVADAEALAERLAKGPVGRGGTAVCAAPEAAVTAALAEQERLVHRLRGRGTRPDRTPLAVVTIDARDPARAAAEAIAAVEAML